MSYKKTAILLISSSIFLAACNAPLTEQEQIQKIDEMYELYTNKNLNISEIEQRLQDNLKNVTNKKIQSDMVDMYAGALHQKMEEINQVIFAYPKEFYYYLNDMELNIKKKSDIEKIDNPIIKEAFIFVHTNKLIFEKVHDSYVASVDYDYILSTYDKNMSEELKDFLLLQQTKNKKVINMMDNNVENTLESLAFHIENIQRMLDKYPNDSFYNSQNKDEINHLYKLYFGLNHVLFFESRNEKLYVKDEVLTHYKKVNKETKTEKLKKLTKDIISLYESSNKEKTPELQFAIEDMFNFDNNIIDYDELNEQLDSEQLDKIKEKKGENENNETSK